MEVREGDAQNPWRFSLRSQGTTQCWDGREGVSMGWSGRKQMSSHPP